MGLRGSFRPAICVLTAAGVAASLAMPAQAPAAGAPLCAGQRATLLGTNGPDVIRATKRTDVVYARGGADRIKGVTQADIVCSGSGRDRVSALIRRRGPRSTTAGALPTRGPVQPTEAWVLGPGDDRIELRCGQGPPGDFFEATFPQIDASSGDDVIIDDCPLAEHLLGGSGDDRIVAGAGYDTIYGGDGDDVLIDRFSTVADCDQDAPPLPGWDGPDRQCVPIIGLYLPTEDLLDGEAGNDVVIGGEANDAVAGGDGDDQVSGGGGNDFLSGGLGIDVCDGGDGDGDINNRAPSNYDEHDCETELAMEDIDLREQRPPPPAPDCSRTLQPESSAFATCLRGRPRLVGVDWTSSIDLSSQPDEIVTDFKFAWDGEYPVDMVILSYAYDESWDAPGIGHGGGEFCTHRPQSDGLIHCYGSFDPQSPPEGGTIELRGVTVGDSNGGRTTYTASDLEDPVLFAPSPAPGPVTTTVTP